MLVSTKSLCITVRFTFLNFPLSKFLCLLGFLQRDLHFLISRCHKSSACLVFYSEICIFRFPAVINLLSARFSTAGITFSYFPLLQTVFLPDFQQRDLHFPIFRCCKHSSFPDFQQRDLHFLIFRCQNSSACLVFYSEICNF